VKVFGSFLYSFNAAQIYERRGINERHIFYTARRIPVSIRSDNNALPLGAVVPDEVVETRLAMQVLSNGSEETREKGLHHHIPVITQYTVTLI
jgi:hypothetical protein